MRRLGKRDLSRGWQTWLDGWLERQRHMRMLAGAAGRLMKPKLAAAVTAWREDWAEEQRRILEEGQALLRAEKERASEQHSAELEALLLEHESIADACVMAFCAPEMRLMLPLAESIENSADCAAASSSRSRSIQIDRPRRDRKCEGVPWRVWSIVERTSWQAVIRQSRVHPPAPEVESQDTPQHWFSRESRHQGCGQWRLRI